MSGCDSNACSGCGDTMSGCTSNAFFSGRYREDGCGGMMSGVHLQRVF